MERGVDNKRLTCAVRLDDPTATFSQMLLRLLTTSLATDSLLLLLPQRVAPSAPKQPQCTCFRVVAAVVYVADVGNFISFVYSPPPLIFPPTSSLSLPFPEASLSLCHYVMRSPRPRPSPKRRPSPSPTPSLSDTDDTAQFVHLHIP